MGGKELKTIHVSKEVWRRLMDLKRDLELRSLDDVIRWLLASAGLKSSENKEKGG
jgi:predicted CopG family antitoxin